MNEYILLNGVFPNQTDEIPFGNRACDYEHTPTITSVEELEKIERLPLQMVPYLIPTKVLNSFLTSKFEHELTDFMRMYGRAHFKALGMNFADDDLELIVSIHHIPEKLVCVLGQADDASMLSTKLADYQSTIVKDRFGRSQLNLHDNNVRKFTLIHANFNLEAEKKLFCFGYHFVTEKFRFFIKSSSQFDLTVLYEDL